MQTALSLIFCLETLSFVLNKELSMLILGFECPCLLSEIHLPAHNVFSPEAST